MSERKWTTPQRHSIEARGGSVLVSAAAGSGKTAVLVERVIRRITDEHDPVDVNRLLVVTFTRAAAAEMRQRLSDALAKKIAEHPEDERGVHLRRIAVVLVVGVGLAGLEEVLRRRALEDLVAALRHRRGV